MKKNHGHRKNGKKSKTYISWSKMIERCTNEKHDNYKYYGAKGVQVCERWREFSNFLLDMGERPEGKTLDRIDPTGDYSPENCRWADAVTQALNKRRK